MRHLTISWYLVVLPLFPTGRAAGQAPPTHFTDLVEGQAAAATPELAYTLGVDSADLTAYRVQISIRNVPDTFHLALAVHPEYDDRFYRYVEDLTATDSAGGPVSITRVDSTSWRVATRGGRSVVRYRIHLPDSPPTRSAWVPFLSSTGGLLGGMQSFMYVVGATLTPARVRLDLPPGWQVATGLVPTSDPRSFFAASAFVLLDSPILVGQLRTWEFEVDGVPHRVVYLPAANATPFDTLALVAGIRGIAEQAIALFGRAPYREYTFLLQDASLGALEHLNSVTIGAPSADLARDQRPALAEIAHEYFHAWNLMRIRPAEYGDVSDRAPPRSHGLWWSEGLTMFYADLLTRRAGLPGFEPTRLDHLAELIRRYNESPGQRRFSAESISAVAYGSRPGALGDYTASPHLRGEIIGTLLDFAIRNATDGRRSMDDVMRLMLERYSGHRGFDGAGVERAVHQVCSCAVHQIFERYVRSAHPIDFASYLRPMGLALRVSWSPATDDSGHAVPDLRIFPYSGDGPQDVKLIITTPDGVWGRAGVHTGDRLESFEGVPISSAQQFLELRNRLRIGQTAQLQVTGAAGARTLAVVVRGFDRPMVKVEEMAGAGPRTERLRAAWERGR
ncbi:MAG TPA: hypothetical protein VMG41_04580 [Gemmatimonadales bacterium]|nr:hypothetical protein [Gemmatimonadales bacterium]